MLEVVSVLCHKDVIDHSCPSLIPSGCKVIAERMAQKKIQKWRTDANLFSCF
jgi:hypothetical protein